MKTETTQVSPVPAMKVIWSAPRVAEGDEERLCRLIDRAATEKASGVELSARSMDAYIAYRSFPPLAASVDAGAVERSQAFLRRVSEHAAGKGLRFGIRHSEISGPENLLDLAPQLRAADGLIDLESPALYDFLRARAAEFFSLFPRVDELVLTMAEARFSVLRRPFCRTPVSERVPRILQALLDALEPLGKTLVVRSFSPLREEELHVLEACRKLQSPSLVLMRAAEAFAPHPPVPDGLPFASLSPNPPRVEADAGDEDLGQAFFPCSHTGPTAGRLEAAATGGARTAVVSLDCSARNAALEHPLAEANLIAVTRRALNPARPIEDFWREWCSERHGFESPALRDVLERTFEVVRKSLSIDRHAFAPGLFPELLAPRRVSGFGLLEEGVPLGPGEGKRGAPAGPRTPAHEQALAEKNDALALALGILNDFDSAAAGMPEASRGALRASLEDLPLLALACLGLTRLAVAHLEEAWKRPVRATDAFETESRRFLELAARIDRERGPDFWLGMTGRMRSLAQRLARERAVEMPLRERIESRGDVLDYVLCGFVSEGHRLQALPGDGWTAEFQDRPVRTAGAGPEQGFGYRLKTPGAARAGRKVALTFAGQAGHDAPAVVRIGSRERSVAVGPLDGFKTLDFDAPHGGGKELAVAVWGAASRPVQVAEILFLA